MRVLVVGYNAWDVVFPCVELPPADAKREERRMVAGGGGPAATAACALARLGAAVSYVGVMADDPPGLMQREELRRAGVDLRHAVEAKGSSSPLAVCMTDEERGERRICWSRGDLPHLDPERVDPAWLDDVDLVLCDGHEPTAALRLVEAAAERGLPRVLDGGTPRPGLAELAAACSDVIGAADFARGVTGFDDPLEALRALKSSGPEVVAASHGAAGCVLLTDDEPVHVPAFAVPVVDTTGAGDVFHAGYAWGLLRGAAPRERCVFGAAAAALAVGALGGRTALPTADAVLGLTKSGRCRCEAPPGYGLRSRGSSTT